VVDDVAENVDAGKATDQVSNGVLKPLGLGSTAKEGVSRVNPINLNEELALKEIMSDPFKGNIAKLKKGMTDDRWHKKDGWKKMTWNNGGVEIHYVGQWQEGVLKAVDDFKIIIP
jgi:filamentous hemagglutinin